MSEPRIGAKLAMASTWLNENAAGQRDSEREQGNPQGQEHGEDRTEGEHEDDGRGDNADELIGTAGL